MPDNAKTTLHRYLQIARDALVWKLDGLSEYDVRRPVVPSGATTLGRAALLENLLTCLPPSVGGTATARTEASPGLSFQVKYPGDFASRQ